MVSSKSKSKKNKKEEITFFAKGQIIGQAFIFILAAILFSLILLFGYRAISRIGETQSEVELIEFKDGLSSAVGKVRLDYGSVKKYSLKIPDMFKEVCLIDLAFMTGLQGGKKLEALKNVKPLIVDAIEAGTDQNVFTNPFSKTPITIGAIETGNAKEFGYPAYMCIKNTGVVIDLRLEGLGDRTRISLWE